MIAFLVLVAFLLATDASSTPGSLTLSDSSQAKTSPVPPKPPEEAICQVCFMRGEGPVLEKVKASAVHEGTTYYFCSAECGKAFEADPAGFVPVALPRPAPGITVRDLDGKPLDLESLKGRTVLLDFWATWCKPCEKTMPILSEFQARYREKNLVVLGVSIDESPDKVRKYVEKRRPGYQIALDDTKSPTWQAYRVKVVPTAYLIDAKGQLIAEWFGNLESKSVAALLDSVLASPVQGAR